MDRMSSIEIAMNNEQTEMNFYLAEAKRSNNPVAKVLFETLAEDEKEHMTRIQSLHGKLVANGSWPEDMPIEVAGTNIKKNLDKIARDQSTAKHDLDDMEALNKGVAFEEKGAKFYADLAKECKNPQEKKFFQFLAGIEREHMLSIKDSIFFLEDPQGWHEAKQRQNLDGA